MQSIKEKLKLLFQNVSKYVLLLAPLSTQGQIGSKIIIEDVILDAEQTVEKKTEDRNGITWQAETINKEFNETKPETEKIYS